MPAPPPAVARESLQGHYAGFASRFAAFVVDLVVLTGIFMLVLAAINFATSIVTGLTALHNLVSGKYSTATQITAVVVFVVIEFLLRPQDFI